MLEVDEPWIGEDTAAVVACRLDGGQGFAASHLVEAVKWILLRAGEIGQLGDSTFVV